MEFEARRAWSGILQASTRNAFRAAYAGETRRKIGGMNHFLLPFWNGEGSPSPRYGDIAIAGLLRRLEGFGCQSRKLQAKVFGGAALARGGAWNVGERNAVVAMDLLLEAKIPVVRHDLGGTQGRRIRFLTATGEVFVRRMRRLLAPPPLLAAPKETR